MKSKDVMLCMQQKFQEGHFCLNMQLFEFNQQLWRENMMKARKERPEGN